MRRAPMLAALVLAAGCGGSGSGKPHLKALVQQGPIGVGAKEVWFYAAEGKPRSLVIFLHGYGGPTEETPANHVAWLKHLAAEGSDVIYPRYEVGGSPNPYPNIDAAIVEARPRLGNPHVPVVVIGYSRGTRAAGESRSTTRPFAPRVDSSRRLCSRSFPPSILSTSGSAR